MKQIALAEIKDDLSRFLREAEADEIVNARHGKLAGVLVGFASGDDWLSAEWQFGCAVLAPSMRAASLSLVVGRILNHWTVPRLTPILRCMSGISFVVDGRGRRKAVLIDLDQHRETWEDFHDALIVKSRRREPRESLSEVEKRLAKHRRG